MFAKKLTILDTANIAKKEERCLITAKLLATNTKQLANYTITFISFAYRFVLTLKGF
jgi:hypothetical protein